jgi:WD40 repeat protein
MRSRTVDDDRILAKVRRIAEPVEPRADFLDDLYESLAGELGFHGEPARDPAHWLDRRGRPRSQRMRVLLWLAAAALLALAVLGGVAVVGALLEHRTTPAPPLLHNGPILVGSEGTSWWIDPVSGETITAGLPRLPHGVQDAAWSRDGLRLAIVLDGDLELVDPGSGVRTILVTCSEIGWACEPDAENPDAERPGSIDWSPDARWIGVARPNGLLRIEVNSGTVGPILDRPNDSGIANLSWSPDGRRIAFEFVTTKGPEGGDVSLKRWVEVVRADGSDWHRISPPTPPESFGAGQPLWSPDGTQLVYLTSDAWIEIGNEATGGWPMKAAVLEVADGESVGSHVNRVDLLTFPCLGFCPSFTLAPDGLSVLVDTGDGLVLAPLDGSPQVALAPDGRVLAWRPVP